MLSFFYYALLNIFLTQRRGDKRAKQRRKLLPHQHHRPF